MAPDFTNDPIIVYGAPRSGTTYLQRLLSAHPAVCVTDETRVFAWLYHALHLTQDDRFLLSHRDAFAEHLRVMLPDVIRHFYRQLAPDAARWGDKNPHYADPFNRGCLEMVLELFPETQFIHIIRDGRDVVSSLMRKSDGDKPWVTFDAAHFTWSTHVDRGSSFGRSLPEDRYFELRYEALVADDLAVAAEMFRFLGLGLDASVKEFCRGQDEKRTPFKGPTRDLELGVQASDWSLVFNLEEQAKSLHMIGSRLVQYGYETEESLAELRRLTAAAPAS